MSCRLACAVAALSLAAPAAAFADTGGGAEYSTEAASTQSAHSSTRARTPAVKPGLKVKVKHLGDRVPIKRGMKGRDVKILQDFFNRIGMKVSVDGSFGAGTYRAARRFEKRADRPVDGTLDSDDINALRSVVSQGGFNLGEDDAGAGTAAGTTPPPVPTLAPGDKATINPDGTATAPASAPVAVQQIIAAGNAIATKPYKYGGGHGKWDDSGYDCSGSVSYALHGADLLKVARDSTGLETFGEDGPGQWVTVYGKASHAYMVVAGLRFDTSGRSKNGTRWQSDMRTSDGYVVRHPAGL